MNCEENRGCKNPVKFISGWPGLFAGLEMLNPVRPVVLEADPGPSGLVNDRIPEFRSSGGFSGGKKKVKKSNEIFFLTFPFFWILSFFGFSVFHSLLASIIAMTIDSCYHSYLVWVEKIYVLP